MLDLNNLYFVTGNKHKHQEVESILGIHIKNISLDIDEIQDLSIENIIKKKAQEAYKQIGSPIIVDDSGVYFEAWNGFPGPLSKFLDKAGGVELVLKMLENQPNRNVTLKTAVGYHNGTHIHVFIGEMSAQIAMKAEGANGWGWDTIFLHTQLNKTFAQMTNEEKNSVSHRNIAWLKLKDFLANQPTNSIKT